MKDKPNKIWTLCLVCKDSQILLAVKKLRWGAGKLNGYGGKVRRNETVENAAKRELKRESGLTALNMEEIGFIMFEFQKPSIISECYFFRVKDFKGKPKESGEMGIGQWYDMKMLPLEEMWEGDRLWMPYFLKGQKFQGRVIYNNPEEKKVVAHHLSEW